MGRFWLHVLCAMAASLATAASPAAATPQTSQQSKVFAVPITGWPGVGNIALEPAQLQVLLDGTPQPIADLLTSPSAHGQVGGARPWQIVIYFEALMSTPDGLRKAALFLSRESEALVRLGTIEIVLADARPRVVLEPSSNPVTVKEVLRDIRAETLNVGELQWHRQRFLTTEDGERSQQATRALQEEVAMLEKQRAGLLRTLAHRASPRPKLLILINNGFDLNPRTFYDQQVARSFLENPRSDWTHAETVKAIAADGWTTLVLALGPRAEEFDDPFAPLFELTRATGGEVITRQGNVADALAHVGSWPIVQVRLLNEDKAGPLPFEVVYGTDRRKLKSTQWAAAEPASVVAALAIRGLGISEPDGDDFEPQRPVLKILRPDGLGLQGPVRFRTVTGRQRIHRVTFLLDEQVVADADRTPFTALIDLGATVRPCTVTVVAYSKSGRELGRDTLELNMALEPPRVTIEQLYHDSQSGILSIAAIATSPAGSGPESVQIILNDEVKAFITEPPYETHFEVASLEPADIVRVVAQYPDGQIVEAAKLPGVAGLSDQLEVNFVELLAIVTPRSRKTKTDLDRTDFVIRRQGKPLPIDQFSRWEELPLTLGLVLDTSESMNEILDDARVAGERFFQAALRTGDEAFVVDFSNLPRLVRHRTTDSELLLHSLEGLEAKGMTALYDAIVFSLQQFKNSSGRRALVVVTDGEDSHSYYQPRECVRQARMHGVPIYLIVLGTPPDPHREPYLLRNHMVARRTGGEVYYISDLDDLSRIYDQVASELRRQYFLGFNAGHTLSPEELEDIEIEVLDKGISVRTLLASQQRGG